MAYSSKCLDLTTHWNRRAQRCVPCPMKPGYEVNPNCGYDDSGGRHVKPHERCKPDTFNDGSGATCQPCTTCPPGHPTVRPCDPTGDTRCKGYPATKVPDKVSERALGNTPRPTPATSMTQISKATSAAATTNPLTQPSSVVIWAVPLTILISITLAVLFMFKFYLKRKRGRHTMLGRRSQGISPLDAPTCTDELKDILGSEIPSAPLQTVLDNLDVLEQLIILLDPDCPPVKNTRHLASHCSFSSTWITYAYSMKESKSPLRAVLEGVTSRYPDWTVGHLAVLLKQMKRNDAVAALSQLRLNEVAV